MAMNLTVVCFSKDRPLQLRAYLESLMYYSGIPQNAITVLYKECPPILYDRLITMFPDVTWVKEADFRADLRAVVDAANDHILWGCDDVVYIGEWDPIKCMEMFEFHPEVFAVGLRGGFNLPDDRVHDPALLKEWGLFDTWQQPWETGSSLYRKSDVVGVLDTTVNPDFFIDGVRTELKGTTVGTAALNPNYLEALGCRNIGFWLTNDRKHLAHYEFSRTLCFAVNVVQFEFKNAYGPIPCTLPGALYEAFLEGKSLNWKRLHNYRHFRFDIESEQFVVE